MPRCPWYINGLCYSEKTIGEYGTPHQEPTRLGYCMSENYRECPYYTDVSREDELLKSLGVSPKLKYYPPIHIIPCQQRSLCPFYKIEDVDKGKGLCVARCLVTEMYIVKSKVSKCIEDWMNCPFYKIGIEEKA